MFTLYKILKEHKILLALFVMFAVPSLMSFILAVLKRWLQSVDEPVLMALSLVISLAIFFAWAVPMERKFKKYQEQKKLENDTDQPLDHV